MATLRQKLALRKIVEKRGKGKPTSLTKIMREVGYAEATIKNPKNLTESRAFIRVLERAGLSDEKLAKSHLALLESARIVAQTFHAEEKQVIITHSNQGKKLRKPEKQVKYQHIPDDVITALIESVPGHHLLYIQKGHSQKTAYFRSPEAAVQSKQIEMAYKVKGHFAAEKLEVVEHELTEEEEEIYNNISGKNKKK